MVIEDDQLLLQLAPESKYLVAVTCQKFIDHHFLKYSAAAQVNFMMDWVASLLKQGSTTMIPSWSKIRRVNQGKRSRSVPSFWFGKIPESVLSWIWKLTDCLCLRANKTWPICRKWARVICNTLIPMHVNCIATSNGPVKRWQDNPNPFIVSCSTCCRSSIEWKSTIFFYSSSEDAKSIDIVGSGNEESGDDGVEEWMNRHCPRLLLYRMWAVPSLVFPTSIGFSFHQQWLYSDQSSSWRPRQNMWMVEWFHLLTNATVSGTCL
jgi:hypothetical protein